MSPKKGPAPRKRGSSANIYPALPKARLGKIYFEAEGKPFIVVGLHWVPAKTALQWAQDWNPSDIEKDFAKIRELGCSALRFDLFWSWFEPQPGVYSEKAFAQFDALIEIARRQNLYLHPTLFIGGEVGEAFWDLPWRAGRHPHADPEMLRLETDHAAEFARRYRGEPAILAWDLTDEPPFWVAAGKMDDSMALNWTRLISWSIKRNDPDAIICVGTSMEDLGHGPFRPDVIAPEVDFLSSHPYPIYALRAFPDPMLSERGSYCGAFQTVLSRGTGRPLMLQEFGASSAQYDPERIGMYERITLFSGLANGAMGFMPWCYTDAAPETFARAPYIRAPHETQFGVCTWDRKDRPAGRALRGFAKTVSGMDLRGVEPAPAEAALLVPGEWARIHGDLAGLGLPQDGSIPYTSVQDANGSGSDEDNAWLMGGLLSSFILCRRAGLKAEMPREEEWKERSLRTLHGARNAAPAFENDKSEKAADTGAGAAAAGMAPALPRLLFLPSPLSSTEKNLVHVHTDFWSSAAAWVKKGGALYTSLCADAAIPGMKEIFGASLSDHTPETEITITIIEDFCGLKKGDMARFSLPAMPRFWPALLKIEGGRVIAEDSAGRPVIAANRLGAGRTMACACPLEACLASVPMAFEGGNPAEDFVRRLYAAFSSWAGLRPLFESGQPSVETAALVGKGRGYTVLVNHSSEAEDVVLSSRLKLAKIRLLGPLAGRTASDRALSPKAADGGWRISIGPCEGAVYEWKEGSAAN